MSVWYGEVDVQRCTALGLALLLRLSPFGRLIIFLFSSSPVLFSIFVYLPCIPVPIICPFLSYVPLDLKRLIILVLLIFSSADYSKVELI